VRLPFRSSASGRPDKKRHPVIVGIVFFVVVLIGFTAAFNKHRLLTDAKSGHMVTAMFSRQYLLKGFQSPVKIAGVPVGTVTGAKAVAGGAEVSMKIDNADYGKLGTEPTAAIRLTTLLGGNSFVQLAPGGSSGTPRGTIPLSRTTVPVYFDNVLAAITPPAQAGTRQFIDQTAKTLDSGGEQSAEQALANAPGALVPGGQVLNALEGQKAGDLEGVVTSFSQTAQVLTQQMGQIETVVSGLGTVSATLGQESGALATTVADLPTNLRTTNSGLVALTSTLNELDETATPSRPAIQQLSQLLVQAQPTLVDAAPVLSNLDPFLQETDPLLTQLVPTATTGTKVLNDIAGPVLTRLNGPTSTSADGKTLSPILPALTAERSVELQKPATLYQELGYVAAGLDGAASYYNASGHFVPVILGENTDALFGLASTVGQDLGGLTGVRVPSGTAQCSGLACPGTQGTASQTGPAGVIP
jgi:phospholipid/cholesterol/gamma-HCH transport system substrate-binding protein